MFENCLNFPESNTFHAPPPLFLSVKFLTQSYYSYFSPAVGMMQKNKAIKALICFVFKVKSVFSYFMVLQVFLLKTLAISVYYSIHDA